MSRVLFTADCHFFHHGIIARCARPFSTVDEMNRGLVSGWNAVVRPSDKIWCVGDFAHKAADPGRLRNLFDSLHGEKHLIAGNHDGIDTLTLPWASVGQVAETVAEGQRVFLSHYALRVWPSAHRGAWQLFGHSHGKLAGSSRSLDVGTDCWGYCPATVPQIRERLNWLLPFEAEDDIERQDRAAICP